MTATKRIRISAGPFVFVARLETEKAPATCALFAGLLPFRNKVIHSRWSGEAAFDIHAERPSTVRFVERMEALIDHPFEATRARPIE